MATPTQTLVLWIPEVAEWYRNLPANQVGAVDFAMELLRQRGAMLGMPYAHKVVGTKEAIIVLRPSVKGEATRIFYAFDPNRAAVLLVGASKKGVADENTWTRHQAEIAGRRWDAYLRLNKWR